MIDEAHLAAGELVDFSLGLIEDARREQLERHLSECEACQALVVEELRSSRAETSEPELRIGRFLVKRVVGAGAMGLVCEAYDPQLDRRVAIKLQRGPERPGDHRRVLDEARAMARLTHPHIVAVYEIGREDETSFLVFEFVEGRTLRQHFLDPGSTPARRLELVVQAGRGLAAAHRAGIVHRDFKPENVLVDEAGHARVTDFGVAAFAPRSGLVGTPAYLAPEILEGHEATARSDQYSLCVTAFEALTGTRPETSRPRWPAGVSRRLRQAIERGLGPAGARFSSIDALLDELEPRERPRVVTLAVAVALVAVVGGLVLVGVRGRDRCDGADRLAEVWGPDDARALASLDPRGLDTSANAWAARWLAEYRFSCEATEVRREASARLLDARMSCLERRRHSLAAALSLARQTPALAERLIASLPAPDDCRGAGPSGEWPPPTLEARTVDAVSRDLADAELLVDANLLSEARARVESLLRQVPIERALELRTRATFLDALVKRELGERGAADRELVWVHQQALKAGDDELALRAAVGRARTIGLYEARLDEALTQLELARGIAERLPTNNVVVAAFFRASGEVLMKAERFDEAEVALLEGRERARLAGNEFLERYLEYNLTEACLMRGRWGCAVEHARAALALSERHSKPDTPSVVGELCALATALVAQGGRRDEVRAILDRVKTVLASLPSEQAPSVWAFAWSTEALDARSRGQFSTAVSLARRAAEVFEKTQPSRAGRVRLEVAFAEVLAGDFTAAEQSLRRASTAPDALRVRSWSAAVTMRIARVRGDLRAQRLAAADVQPEAMTLLERTFGEVELGELELVEGHSSAAAERCDRLEALLKTTPMSPEVSAPIWFFCARAVKAPERRAALLELARPSYERGEQPAYELTRFQRFIGAR